VSHSANRAAGDAARSVSLLALLSQGFCLPLIPVPLLPLLFVVLHLPGLLQRQLLLPLLHATKSESVFCLKWLLQVSLQYLNPKYYIYTIVRRIYIYIC